MNRHSGTVIVAVHDGFYGCGTGAGRSNRAFLRILAAQLTPGTRLVVLPVQLSPASPEYDHAWHREVLCEIGPSADVIPVGNGTSGTTRFAGLGSFRHASRCAAQVIADRFTGAGHTLIVAFDVPYYEMGAFLPGWAAARLVTAARATAALQAPGDHARISWERRSLQAAAARGGKIAATSAYMAAHLEHDYAIPRGLITPLTNGLTPGEHDQAHSTADHLLPQAARSGFMLSFGRAEPYKGFGDLLSALTQLRDGGLAVPHTVLAAVTEEAELTAYQQHLAGQITAGCLDVTLLTRFSPQIRTLLSHPALAAVIVPSRTEPFGRIPLEAFAARAAPVIATTAGGLAEQVHDGITGYTARPADPHSLAAAIRRGLRITPQDREAMRAAGCDLLTARYDYAANITAFLQENAPWVTARRGKSA
jgi:glycosyltransferase involved in cell wall biosynthesis